MRVGPNGRPKIPQGSQLRPEFASYLYLEESQINAIYFAIRLGRTDKMDYRYKDDKTREQWKNYDPFLVAVLFKVRRGGHI